MKVEVTAENEKAIFSEVGDGYQIRLIHGIGHETVTLRIVGIPSSRMKFDRTLAGELASLLQRFADTGKLAEEEDSHRMTPETKAEVRKACEESGIVFIDGTEQSEPTHAEQLDFIRSRGWVPFKNNLWVKSINVAPGSVFSTPEEAYRAEMEPQEPGPVVDAEYLPIEGAVSAFLRCQKDVAGAKTQLLEAQQSLGAATVELMRYKVRVRDQEVAIRIDGSLYILRFTTDGIDCVEARTPQWAEFEDVPW